MQEARQQPNEGSSRIEFTGGHPSLTAKPSPMMAPERIPGKLDVMVSLIDLEGIGSVSVDHESIRCH